MKKFFVTMLLVAATVAANAGTGSVLFNNYDGNNGANAPITDATQGNALATGFRAILWGGSSAETLAEMGPFAAAVEPGFFDDGSRNITNLSADGGTATLQVRAWKGNATTWAEAVTLDLVRGVSNIFTASTGNPNSQPPGTPGPMSGLQSFAIGVPEPSTIGLGIFGLGAMIMRRRKAAKA